MTLAVIGRWLLKHWLPIALVLAALALYGKGRHDGREGCEARYAAAEAKADAKAAKAGQRAHKAADEASATIKKETDHAAAEVREIVRTIPRACPDPVLPPRVQDIGRAAVERANRAL